MKPIAALLIPLALAGQELRFHTLPPADTAPSGRLDGVIVHDPASRQIFLFGGRDSAFRNDLWAYSLDGGLWRELRPSGSPPAPRFGHTVVLDPQRHRLILFGGQAGGFFSDTWSYDIDSNAWRQLARDDAGPSRRYGHSAVLDANRDRMIVSHGFTDAGRFDDTWAFDLARNTWRNISPTSGRPLRRCLHHAVMDDEGGQMLLYGGCASGFGPCPLGDLWSFDVNTNRWTERTGAAKPPARQWYGVTFDSARRAMVLFAGSGERGPLNDAWEYRPASGVWTPLDVSQLPRPRERLQGAFFAGLGPVFFGGSTDRGNSNDLLVLAPGIVNAFSGRPGARSAGELIALYGRGLGPEPAVAAAPSESGDLPRSLGGVSLTVNGIEAGLLFAGPDQINAQIPREVAGAREAVFLVTGNGAVREPVTVPLAPATPGVHPEIRIEDGIWTLLVTGYGPAESAEGFAVTVGGRPVEILSAQPARGMVGVLEMRVRVPEGIAPGAGVSIRSVTGPVE